MRRQWADFGEILFLSLLFNGLNFAEKCYIIYITDFDFTERKYER